MEQEYLQIDVKTLTGKITKINIKSTLKINELKQIISKSLQIGVPESFRIIFFGIEMDDEKHVNYYNLKDNNTIHVVLKLRGC